MDRPKLSKIVLKDLKTDLVINAIRSAAPNVNLVIADGQDEVAREIVDAQVLIGGGLTDEQLRSADQLAWHHVPWVGVESILNPILAEKGILLTNGSGVNSTNIAEHVIAMMLAFARDLPKFVRDQARHAWRDWDNESPHFFEIGGQRVLCLGTGDIGQEVARMLAGFGCELVGASRSGREVPGFQRCVPFAELAEELAEADHIVNSLPMTQGTDKIVSRDHFQAMKRGAYFYNVGRGGTVDQDAMIESLQSGHLAGAGLDVVTPEPLGAESPLWDMHNVIITSHTSGNSPVAQQRMADLAAEQLLRYQKGEQLLNVVDLTAGY